MRRELLALSLLAFTACTLGPKYHRPTVVVPASYKEWKQAKPQDAAIRGKWWELFADPTLNSLEKQVNVSNQTIAAAFASFLQARALVREARAGYFPSLSVAPTASIQGGTSSQSGIATSFSGTFAQYSLPLDASWAPDLWGRIRSAVAQSEANAQVSAADLANQRLIEQADLAIDYYEMRGQDAMIDLLTSTVRAYEDSLRLTRSLFRTGIDPEENIAQAEAQLKTAQAQATNLGIARAQYEHAIALLIGKPASDFSLPPKPFAQEPPRVPVGVPSSLLERRPDIAAAERAMAAANAQIGMAISAFYPNLTLNGSAGVGSNTFSGLLSVPSFIWSLGASLSETIFDAGLRSATVDQYKAAYDQSVAGYRQAVLTAFQQTEDALSGIRISTLESGQQKQAVEASGHYLAIATRRFKLGIDPYLDVITAQLSLLGNEQNALTLQTQRMVLCVQLIEALGGGWDGVLQ